MSGKSFLKRQPMSSTMTLQITSMADIFIIILVFILKSYASGSLNITPLKGSSLPEGKTPDSSVEALKIEVAEAVVLVEGSPAASVSNFAFNPADLEQTGISKSLNAVLAQQRKKEVLISKSNTQVKVDPRIIIVADKRVPYSTIKTVLASAAVNGYTDFKLAVVNTN